MSKLLRLGNCDHDDDDDEDYNGDNGEGWPGVGPLTIGGIPRMASSYYEVLPTPGYLLSLLMRTIIDHKYSNDHAEKLMRIVMAHTLLLPSGLDLLNTTFLPRCLPSVLHTQAISNMLSAHFVIIMRV